MCCVFYNRFGCSWLVLVYWCVWSDFWIVVIWVSLVLGCECDIVVDCGLVCFWLFIVRFLLMYWGWWWLFVGLVVCFWVVWWCWMCRLLWWWFWVRVLDNGVRIVCVCVLGCVVVLLGCWVMGLVMFGCWSWWVCVGVWWCLYWWVLV